MRQCIKCKKQGLDHEFFCSECGGEIKDVVVCLKCGNMANSSDRWCAQCGTELSEMQEKVIVPQEKSKKPLVFGLLAAVIIIAGFVICKPVLSSQAQGSDYAVYLKNDEIYAIHKTEMAPIQISTNLAKKTPEDGGTQWYGRLLGTVVKVEENGRGIYYPEGVGIPVYACKFEEGYDLNYYSFEKPEKESRVVESGVYDYVIGAGKEVVTYITENNDLDRKELSQQFKEKKDISQVSLGYIEDDYFISEDGLVTWVRNREGNLYLKQIDSAAEMIDGSVEKIEHISTDGSACYYFKENDFYKARIGEEPEVIFSDILSLDDFDVVKIYETGEIYFAQRIHGEQKVVGDFIRDDLYMPDQYEVTSDSWLRNDYRDWAFNSHLPHNPKVLYYYDGKTLTKLDPKVSYTLDMNSDTYKFAEDKPIIIYRSTDIDAVQTYRFSEIWQDDPWEWIDSIEYDFEHAGYITVAYGAETYSIKAPEVLIESIITLQDVEIASDNSTVYFKTGYWSEDDNGISIIGEQHLYSAPLEKRDIEGVELVLQNVYDMKDLGKDMFIYNAEDGFYVNGKKIDSNDVDLNHIQYNEATDTFIYRVKWDFWSRSAVLKIYDRETQESVIISDDVFDYLFDTNGDVLYISNYNGESESGDLYLYTKDGGSKKLTDGVQGLIVPMTREECNENGWHHYYSTRVN